MSWEKIQSEIDTKLVIREVWPTLVSYDINQFPQLKRDLSTITVNLGRRAGHTSYIRNNAKSGDIIICFNHLMARAMLNGLRTDIEVYSKGEMNRLRGTKKRHSSCKLWIDNYSDVLADDYANVLNAVMPVLSPFPTIIRLG
jgi:hypothetical protein